jgi:hypothetical protein
MPAKISLRDARMERMRGRLDEQLVTPQPKNEPPPAPEVMPATSVQAAVTVDTAPIAHAMEQQTRLIAAAMEVMSRPDDAKEPEAPKKWTFRITERDRMGNIIAFTAEAQ